MVTPGKSGSRPTTNLSHELARFLARTQFGVGDDASKVLSPNTTPESRALGSEVVELCENDSYHNNHHPNRWSPARRDPTQGA
jgi:hypothetical protein